MRRRTLLLASGAAAASLAGCTGLAQETDEPATTESDGSGRTLAVRKTGEAEGEPDLAVLQVGVEVRGDSASQVRDDLSERSATLYDAIVDYGIDEDDVTTARFDVRERVDRQRMREDGVEPESEADLEEYREYVGTHSYEVEVPDPDEVGAVIDVAVDAGADDVGSIRFTLSEAKRERLREDAVAAAIEKGRSEAEFVAGQVDAEVVEVEHVDTAGGDVRPVRAEYEEAADGGGVALQSGSANTDLQQDRVTVTATVEAVYEIE